MSDTTNTPAFTALLDQFNAASEHAERAVEELAGDLGPEASAWAKARIDALMHTLDQGRARVCPHIIGQSPRVLFAADWHPGVITCAECCPNLFTQCAAHERCDRCAGPIVGLPHMRLVVNGPLIYVYGLCTPCTDQENTQ